METSRCSRISELKRNRRMPLVKHLATLMACLLGAGLPPAYPAERPAAGNQVELRWSELGPFIVRSRVATVLPDGTVLRGRALAVNEDVLVLDVSKSSDKDRYRKGRAEVPRDQITTLSVREKKGVVGRVVLTIVGVFGGGLLAAGIAIVAEGGENTAASSAAVWGGLVGGGVAGYYAGRSIDVRTTIVKILPD